MPTERVTAVQSKKHKLVIGNEKNGKKRKRRKTIRIICVGKLKMR